MYLQFNAFINIDRKLFILNQGGSRFESGLVSHALCAAMRSMLKVSIHYN